MRVKSLVAVAALGLAPSVAFADPCTGAPPFTDVSASDNFCTNTEWLKNRAVTLGCIGTNYCPLDVVTRGSMALFMNRLGVALTPVTSVTEDSGSVDLDVESFVCASPVFDIQNYPRQATVAAHFSGLTAGAAGYAINIRFNTDASGSFPNPINGNFEFGGSPAAGWSSTSTTANLALQVGTGYRFAVRVIRAATGGGGADLSDSRCHLVVTLNNRNAAASPFDAPAGGVDE